MAHANDTDFIITVTLNEVFHVGTLNIVDQKKDSYEGEGLSISVHPDEWASIARLTGSTHRSTRGGAFVDFHALSTAQRSAALSHAYTNNYIVDREVHEVSWFDDEWNNTFTMSFNNLVEAAEEAVDRDVEVTTVTKPSATHLFPDVTVSEGDTNIEDKIVAVWVNEKFPQFDGVWWEDALNVSKLSAPCGVISVNKVNDWIPTFVQM